MPGFTAGSSREARVRGGGRPGAGAPDVIPNVCLRCPTALSWVRPLQIMHGKNWSSIGGTHCSHKRLRPGRTDFPYLRAVRAPVCTLPAAVIHNVPACRTRALAAGQARDSSNGFATGRGVRQGKAGQRPASTRQASPAQARRRGQPRSRWGTPLGSAARSIASHCACRLVAAAASASCGEGGLRWGPCQAVARHKAFPGAGCMPVGAVVSRAHPRMLPCGSACRGV